MTRSHGVTMNIAYALHARVVSNKWKQFTWLLRHRRARAAEYQLSKRPFRWLAMQQGRELAAIWGRLGVAQKEIKCPIGPPLFR